MNSNKFRPQFHFSCPKGWINDPNGFSFFNGKFHLYYQHNPKDTHWGPMHWGHATSKNLLKWKNQKIALFPDSKADDQGCFSGTALSENDRQILIYTGVTKEGDQNIQQQCIAINNNKTISKIPQNPVIRSSDVKVEFCKTDFRDPKIWKEGDTYYCAAVIKKADNNGAIALFTSSNLTDWNFKSILAQSNGELGGMWECPDFFKLEDKDVIILSPQSVKENKEKGLKEGNNSVYMAGTYDKAKGTFTPDIRPENNFTAVQLDHGIDFYAPQTTEAPDGRRIMIAWMQDWQSYITPENFNWSGMMTLPRELFFKDNCLYQKPVKEYEAMVEKLPFLSGNIYRGMTAHFTKYNYPHCELTLTVRLPKEKPSNPDYEKFTFTISDDRDGFVTFAFDSTTMELTFDRTRSQTNSAATNTRSIKVKANPDRTVKFRFICDTYSTETFINDGQTVFTNTYFLNKKVRKISVDSTLTYGLNFKIINIK